MSLTGAGGRRSREKHEDEEEEDFGIFKIFPASSPNLVESHLLPAACGSSGEDKHIRSDFLSVAPFEGRRAAPTTLTLSNPADFPLNLTRGHGRGGEEKAARLAGDGLMNLISSSLEEGDLWLSAAISL